MKLILLNPPSRHGETVIRDNLYGCFIKGKANYMWPPLNLAQVAAVTENAGIESVILDAMALGYDLKRTIKEIKKQKPDFVFVITATSTFTYDAEFVGLIKKHLKSVKSIFAGTHVMTVPKKCLKFKAVDFIILGEPEYVVRDLIKAVEDQKDLKQLKGIGFRKGSKIILNEKADIIQDLDALPFPARHLIPNADYFNPLAKKLPYTTIISSRGCPFPCNFCVAFLVYGKAYRMRSAKNVANELEDCYKNYGIKEFFFRDELFTFNKKRVMDMCKEIQKRGLKISWICASRANTIDEEMARAMKKAGCHMVKIGVESGSQMILDNLRKALKVSEIEKTFKILNKVGIDSVAHLMLGSPGETRETIRQTINFTKKLNPTYASFNITTPYPGTALWEQVKHKLKLKDFSLYDIESIHEKALFNKAFCDLSKEELEDAFNRAHREFYLRPSYIGKMLLKQGSIGEFLRTARAGIALVKYTIRNSRKHTD